MSVVPPGGNGTTMRTGLEGQVCACAGARTAQATTAISQRANMMSPPWWSCAASLPCPIAFVYADRETQ